jgi:SprT protein
VIFLHNAPIEIDRKELAMTAHTLHTQTRHKVNECIQKCSDYFDYQFTYDDLKFDLGGQSAGQFVALRKPFNRVYLKLRFNDFLLNKYQHAFIEEVVPHECAHLVVFQYFGKLHNGSRVLPHGKQWKFVMRDIYGCEPVVRHKFEVDQKTGKRFNYRCACVDERHELSIVRHNKIKRNKAKYLCKKCKQLLILEN